MESWEKKFKFDKQSEGYAPLHTSRSDQELHTTWRGEEFTIHVYEKDFLWPIGKSPDKWISKKNENKNCARNYFNMHALIYNHIKKPQ